MKQISSPRPSASPSGLPPSQSMNGRWGANAGQTESQRWGEAGYIEMPWGAYITWKITHIKPGIICLPHLLLEWSVIYHFSNFSEYNSFLNGLHLTFSDSALEVTMVTWSYFLDRYRYGYTYRYKFRDRDTPVVLMELFIWKSSWIWNFIDRSYVWQWDRSEGRKEESYLDPNVVSYSLFLRAQEILVWNVYHFSQYGNLSHKVWSRRNRTLLFCNSSWFLLWNFLLPSW